MASEHAACPAAQATNTNQEAYRLQLKMFLALLHQQRHLPSLKQLLKLYTVRLLPFHLSTVVSLGLA